MALDNARLRWLNIGVVMDEGLACSTDAFKLFYGERVPWCMSLCLLSVNEH